LPLILIAFASYLPCQSQGDATIAQAQTVQRFYSKIMTFKEGGIPSKQWIDELALLISASFRKALLAARDAEDRHYKEFKNEEPPLVEGALFYSLFEGPNRLGPIKREEGRKTVSFLVTLEYGDPKDKRQFCSWKDRAILMNENGRWVVNDLELLGKWQLGAKGKLSKILKEVASYGAPVQPRK
jgi:hypothetical protein